ncbi:hypothetical protein PPERSA_10699 [Pseudocohnilembus persalinus]|uniref:Uncharacterized protein n=1 Tax=Pseudocohnilembus persalinus TaxID=266149 RepID=A0A0V0QDJ1_PSEPJ|nr:hypothetical protein PPERSA_10699 [Pseudocohnilembus persalinus]|eukprot:KRX00200.1 hypothetical protein PPERSA_10699 [Pseudocohnilembus persalinus]
MYMYLYLQSSTSVKKLYELFQDGALPVDFEGVKVFLLAEVQSINEVEPLLFLQFAGNDLFFVENGEFCKVVYYSEFFFEGLLESELVAALLFEVFVFFYGEGNFFALTQLAQDSEQVAVVVREEDEFYVGKVYWEGNVEVDFVVAARYQVRDFAVDFQGFCDFEEFGDEGLYLRDYVVLLYYQEEVGYVLVFGRVFHDFLLEFGQAQDLDGLDFSDFYLPFAVHFFVKENCQKIQDFFIVLLLNYLILHLLLFERYFTILGVFLKVY